MRNEKLKFESVNGDDNTFSIITKQIHQKGILVVFYPNITPAPTPPQTSGYTTFEDKIENTLNCYSFFLLLFSMSMANIGKHLWLRGKHPKLQ